MRRRPAAAPLLAALAAALAAPAAASAQEGEPRRYDLELTWKPFVGARSSVDESISTTMRMIIVSGEQQLNEVDRSDTYQFVSRREVLEVDDGDVVRQKAAFSLASRTLDGVETPFAFEGRTVLVGRRGEGDGRFRWEDGSPIRDPEDLLGLQRALREGGGEGEEGEDGGARFAPDGPVAVGESWKPDTLAVARQLGMPTGEDDAVDLAKSSATFTLASVWKRGETQWGKITGEIDLALKRFGPMKLRDPITARFRVTIDACIDGTRPDGELRLDATIEGTSRVEMEGAPPGSEVGIELSMRLEAEMKAALIGDPPAKKKKPKLY